MVLLSLSKFTLINSFANLHYYLIERDNKYAINSVETRFYSFQHSSVDLDGSILNYFIKYVTASL